MCISLYCNTTREQGLFQSCSGPWEHPSNYLLSERKKGSKLKNGHVCLYLHLFEVTFKNKPSLVFKPRVSRSLLSL